MLFSIQLRLEVQLRLAYILCYFIRKLRWALVVCIAFLNAESHIALVDFIVAPKDEGDGLCGAPLLYPLDSNSSPRGIRCGGAYLLPRLTGI